MIYILMIVWWFLCALLAYKLHLKFMRKFRTGLSYGVELDDKIFAAALAILFAPLDMVVGILCNTIEGWGE